MSDSGGIKMLRDSLASNLIDRAAYGLPRGFNLIVNII